DARGARIGSDFQVYASTSFFALPAVAMSANGPSVIAWSGTGVPVPSVFAQPFDAAGVAQNPEVQVNERPLYGFNAAVAMDQIGNFVVAWQGDDPGSGARDYICAKRFTARDPAVPTNSPAGRNGAVQPGDSSTGQTRGALAVSS